MNTEIRIRAFRATDDYETCLKFIDGHRKVLAIYGIENISTNTYDWIYNPSIFVVVVESMDRSRLFGGARLQCADGIHPLPIEDAVGDMDARIHEVVRGYTKEGAGELSGLWNSKEVAGLGIGSFFPSRAVIAIAAQVGVKTVFCLCAPTTVRFKEWLGADLLKQVGNDGTFYYPKLDLIATAICTEDAINLPLALPREREKVLYLRKNPIHLASEKSPFKNQLIDVQYELNIASAKPGEFHLDLNTVNTKLVKT